MPLFVCFADVKGNSISVTWPEIYLEIDIGMGAFRYSGRGNKLKQVLAKRLPAPLGAFLLQVKFACTRSEIDRVVIRTALGSSTRCQYQNLPLAPT